MKYRIFRISLAIGLATLLMLTIILLGTAVIWSGEDVRLTVDEFADGSPSMVQTSDGRIWILWHTYRTGAADIFCNIYDGAFWLDDHIQLTDDTDHDVNPTILQADNGTIWVFWASYRTGNYDIFYKTSSDNGASWSHPATQLTYNASADARPSVMQANDGKIWLAWYSLRTGNDEVFYKTYDGSSWSDNTQLTNDTSSDKGPTILQADNGTIWVFWASYRTGNYDIFYKTSSDNGASWSHPATQLTTHKAWDMLPWAMQAINREIWVAFQSERTGQDDDVYYQIYDGSSWSGDTPLVTDNSDDFLPCIFQATNKTIWVAWTSSRLYNYDIYYTTTTAYPHDVGVASVLPSSTFAYQGYSIDVHVDVWNYGTNTESFNVTVFGNETVIGVETDVVLAANSYVTLTFPWDVSDVPLGYYVISATVEVAVDDDLSDNSFEDGMVQVRIPGDLNGDNAVNVLDATLLSINFGKSPSEYPPADINGDGSIDVCDATLLIINWSV